MKWALNVRIARLALLRRCMSDVGRHFLEFALPDFGDVVEEFGTDFVVHELHVNCKSAPLEAVHEDIIGWDTMMIAF